ncbi:GntR family transcriptional regulator [Streptomyces brasiliensis]|uniref:GntR family transcriptional regulator n=1 Tax=Streptomyces brasiliensis TaxID=1954 RepID=A0A917L741_9ACTN|nr:GntR family transcriptional regulator [Streptomyces brasiliensis]GGJ42759.1 GntR family transcriptional regulator [Streptomyces brasiliensis]
MGAGGNATSSESLRGRVKASPYERLRDAILSGEFEPGAPLVETALADILQVSRTPVREALSKLEYDGLVSRERRGLVVRQRTADEILDIYQTRIVLESAVVRHAAERRTANDLLLLRGLLARWDSVDLSDRSAMREANQAFHEALWRAGHNVCLSDLLSRLALQVHRFPPTTLGEPGRWAEAGAEHAQIVDAVERRDGDEAARITSQHFEESMAIRLRLMATP